MTTSSPMPDMLYVFTGIPAARVLGLVRTMLSLRHEAQTQLARQLTRFPLETLMGFTLASSAAFYLAEYKSNPKVLTFIDAFYYISTCLSVGYADVFAQTQEGKSIAALVMMVGPALTSRALDLPGKSAEASQDTQEEMLRLLEAILGELKRTADVV